MKIKIKIKIKIIFLFAIIIAVSHVALCQLKIKSNGDVGVGPLDPIRAFYVKKSYSGWLTGAHNTSNDAWAVFCHSEGCGAYIDAGTNASSSTYALYVTKSGAPNPYLYVNGAGNVGINTASPDAGVRLHVAGYIKAINVQYPSDERFKKDIKKYEGNLENIKKLEPVTYKMKRIEINNDTSANAPVNSNKIDVPGISLAGTNDSANIMASSVPQDEFAIKQEEDMYNRNRIGFIASDLQKIFPEFVYEDKKNYLSIDYISLIPVLVAAIKEQQEILETMQQEMEILKDRNFSNGENEKLKSKGTPAGMEECIQTGKPWLGQNAPNPFNKNTTIQMFVPDNKKSVNLYI